MFDWNDLKYFLAVARGGSTLAAARMLGNSQSTVHRRLAGLEKHFGCKLAMRSPTGYQLSESGRRLLNFAEGAEEAIATFERHALAADTGLSGSVRVTCSTTMADRLAKSTLIRDFHGRYPGLRVEFVITDKYLDLSKGTPTSPFAPVSPMTRALSAAKSRRCYGRYMPRAPTSSATVGRSGRRTSTIILSSHSMARSPTIRPHDGSGL